MSTVDNLNLLPEGRSLELSKELLQGAIDIHVHPGPHLAQQSTPRRSVRGSARST